MDLYRFFSRKSLVLVVYFLIASVYVLHIKFNIQS